MTANQNTIVKFYNAFSNANPAEMCECYNPHIEFQDPVFGVLKGKYVGQMWKMLIEGSKGNLKIHFSDVKANKQEGSAFWTAEYNFGKANRKVVNTITSKFYFQEGLIIKQIDDFNFWKWTIQSIGISGLLLGWSYFLQKKIQKKAQISLQKYAQKDNQ